MMKTLLLALALISFVKASYVMTVSGGSCAIVPFKTVTADLMCTDPSSCCVDSATIPAGFVSASDARDLFRNTFFGPTCDAVTTSDCYVDINDASYDTGFPQQPLLLVSGGCSDIGSTCAGPCRIAFDSTQPLAASGTQQLAFANSNGERCVFTECSTASGCKMTCNTIHVTAKKRQNARQLTFGTRPTTSPPTTAPVTTAPVTTAPVTTAPVTTVAVTTTPCNAQFRRADGSVVGVIVAFAAAIPTE